MLQRRWGDASGGYLGIVIAGSGPRMTIENIVNFLDLELDMLLYLS